jgi:hypothetical protein
MIAYRRVVRWQGCRREGLGLVDGTPGPKEAWHRLLPEEVANIARLACRPEYADLSHRILPVTVWEKGLCFVSFSSVWVAKISSGVEFVDRSVSWAKLRGSCLA